MEKYHKELDDLALYLKFRIDMLAALRFGFHRSYLGMLVPTTIWYEQIASFEEWKLPKHRWTKSYPNHGVLINYE